MSQPQRDRTLSREEKVTLAFHNVYGGFETLAAARARMDACRHETIESGLIPNGYTEHTCRECGCYWVTASAEPFPGVSDAP